MTAAPVLVLEVVTGSGWERICGVTRLDPPGSLSSDDAGGRNVYLFGWIDGAGPCLWRSRSGVDVEIGDKRLVVAGSLEEIADIEDGPCERSFWSGSKTVLCRFRLVSATGPVTPTSKSVTTGEEAPAAPRPAV